MDKQKKSFNIGGALGRLLVMVFAFLLAALIFLVSSIIIILVTLIMVWIPRGIINFLRRRLMALTITQLKKHRDVDDLFHDPKFERMMLPYFWWEQGLSLPIKIGNRVIDSCLALFYNYMAFISTRKTIKSK